jgi:membrane protease YdiL (CAAX protease family)
VDKKEREYSGFAIVLGVIIVPRFFPYTYNLASLLARELARLPHVSPQSIFPASNLMSFVIGSVLLILVVRCWEGGAVKDLGLRAPLLTSVLSGVVAWLLFEVSSPILLSWGRLVTKLAVVGKISELPPFDRQMWNLSAPWFYAMIAADVVFEEVVTRAYLIERLVKFIGSIWIAGAISFLLSLALHVPGRNFYEALLRAPLILLLVAMYMYTRSLIACSLLHFLVSASLLGA